MNVDIVLPIDTNEEIKYFVIKPLPCSECFLYNDATGGVTFLFFMKNIKSFKSFYEKPQNRCFAHYRFVFLFTIIA